MALLVCQEVRSASKTLASWKVPEKSATLPTFQVEMPAPRKASAPAKVKYRLVTRDTTQRDKSPSNRGLGNL